MARANKLLTLIRLMPRTAILLGFLGIVLGSSAMAQVANNSSPLGGIENTGITWGNVVGAGLVLLALAGFWINWDKRNRENAKEARENNERIMTKITEKDIAFGVRLKELEDRNRDFMPKSEIHAAIEHLKVNRMTVEMGLKETLSKAVEDIIQMRVQQAEARTNHNNLARDVQEIKITLEHQDTKLDKMSECLTKISAQLEMRYPAIGV